MPEPPAPPSHALVAGKYQLREMIGRGGMGSVWEGRHVSLGTRVAVKFIEKEYADSPEARARFDNEARAAATIQSKYAVQIFDHGVTEDGRPYIVMELLEGEGLDKRLERMGRIELPVVARAFQQVCRALQRAHESGVIHRDLKPENIFLQRTPDDDDDTAKVLDFGIAKIRAVDGTTLSSSTKTGAVLGTPYYMSPEQARGLRELDHRTDIWSLGVIAFKCVTGVLPFDGQSLGDLLVKICTAPLPIPSHVVPGLPPAFDAWFARALERDPNARFSTANELADALAFAAGLSARGANSLPHPGMAFGTPHPAAANTPATPAFGATSAPLTATSPGVVKRTNAGLVAGAMLGLVALGGAGAIFALRGKTQARVSSSAASVEHVEHVGVPAGSGLVVAPIPEAADSGAALALASPTGSVGPTKPGKPAKAGAAGRPTASTAPPPPLPHPDPAKTEPHTGPKVDPKTKPAANDNPGF